MLAIQAYLRSGKTPDDLRAELDIDCYRHPSLPLLGFTYRVTAPKFHPIVREARGVVLEDGSWDLVALPFRRFFNYGECPEDDAKFDWEDFEATEKCDGSLIMAFHYRGHWSINTRGSFGAGIVGWSGKAWAEIFWEVSRIDARKLAPEITYLFELWTPYNKVVRTYPEPRAYLLSGFNIRGEWECAPSWRYLEAKRLGVHEPATYHFDSVDDVRAFLQRKEEEDRTYEGVVCRDWEDIRLKVKSKSYLELHYFYDNGNVLSPRRLVPIHLSGDADEVLLHFPEVRKHLDPVADRVDAAFEELATVWAETKDIESQKDFALSVVPRTPFSGILFDVRKRFYGREQTLDDLKAAWRQWPGLVTKKLFGGD